MIDEQPSAAADRALDPAVIDSVRDMTGGDNAFMGELAGAYLKDARQLLDQMRQAAIDGDVELLGRSAHTLKSTSAGLGATRLAAQCRDLESLARSRDPRPVQPLLFAIAHEFERVATELDSLIPPDGAN